LHGVAEGQTAERETVPIEAGRHPATSFAEIAVGDSHFRIVIKMDPQAMRPFPPSFAMSQLPVAQLISLGRRVPGERSPMKARTRRRRVFSAVPVLFLVAALIAAPAGAQSATETIPVGSNPAGIAVNPVTNRVYVANNASNSVTVIDGVTNAAATLQIPSANLPKVVAVNPVTDKIYIGGESDNRVTVIDGATGTTSTVSDPNAAGSNPSAIAVNPVTNKIYIANSPQEFGWPGSVTVIDGATNATSTIALDRSANAIAVNPATNRVYVAAEYYSAMVNFGEMFEIDGTANVATPISSGSGWDGFAVNSATNRIYAAERPPDDSVESVNGVLAIDGATDTTTIIPVGVNPVGIAGNEGTNTYYVADGGSSFDRDVPRTVTVIDGATNATSTIAVGDYIAAIAADPVANKVYVANGYIGGVTVIDGVSNSTRTVLDSNAVNPSSIAVNPVTNKVYVANAGSGNVTVIDGAIPGAPTFESEPRSQAINAGGAVVFNAVAAATSPSTCQWYFNGAPLSDGAGISGSAESTLYLGDATPADTGVYQCVATNSAGSASSRAVVLDVVSSPTPGRLANLSSRASVGSGANAMINGFVVAGSGSKELILRGIGPALASFGVTGALADPVLSVYDSASSPNLITRDSGWLNPPSAPAGPWAQLPPPADASASDFSRVGAFALSAQSIDSAVKITLPAGGYTSQVTAALGDPISGSSPGTGVALAEVYDADTGAPGAELVNLSSRALVGTGGNILIAGFVIEGSTSRTLLIRASGPALIPFGVPGTLPDPQIQVLDGTGALLTSDSGWGGDPGIARAALDVGAFSWSNPASADSAVLATLPPGNYTAQVSGKSGDTGVALIEIYAVP
jgi:YVTN family beta-propeller protein